MIAPTSPLLNLMMMTVSLAAMMIPCVAGWPVPPWWMAISLIAQQTPPSCAASSTEIEEAKDLALIDPKRREQ